MKPYTYTLRSAPTLPCSPCSLSSARRLTGACYPCLTFLPLRYTSSSLSLHKYALSCQLLFLFSLPFPVLSLFCTFPLRISLNIPHPNQQPSFFSCLTHTPTYTSLSQHSPYLSQIDIIVFLSHSSFSSSCYSSPSYPRLVTGAFSLS